MNAPFTTWKRSDATVTMSVTASPVEVGEEEKEFEEEVKAKVEEMGKVSRGRGGGRDK